jgi:hypothetical protein
VRQDGKQHGSEEYNACDDDKLNSWIGAYEPRQEKGSSKVLKSISWARKHVWFVSSVEKASMQGQEVCCHKRTWHGDRGACITEGLVLFWQSTG